MAEPIIMLGLLAAGAGAVWYGKNELANRRLLAAEKTRPGEVEPLKSNRWVEHIEPDSFTFSMRMNSFSAGDFRVRFFRIDKDHLIVSEPQKLSRWEYKRIPMIEAMLESGEWMDKATRYDMKHISLSSFRIEQQMTRNEHRQVAPAFVIVLDYGNATYALNLHKYFAQWHEDYATNVMRELHRAYTHVMGASDDGFIEMSDTTDETPTPQRKRNEKRPQDHDPF